MTSQEEEENKPFQLTTTIPKDDTLLIEKKVHIYKLYILYCYY
jgi:hypothetical protein